MLANRDAGVLGGLYAFDAAVVVAAFFAVARAAGPVTSVWRVFLGRQPALLAVRAAGDEHGAAAAHTARPLLLPLPSEKTKPVETSPSCFLDGVVRRRPRACRSSRWNLRPGDGVARTPGFFAFFDGSPHRRNVPPRGYFRLEPHFRHVKHIKQTNHALAPRRVSLLSETCTPCPVGLYFEKCAFRLATSRSRAD